MRPALEPLSDIPGSDQDLQGPGVADEGTLYPRIVKVETKNVGWGGNPGETRSLACYNWPKRREVPHSKREFQVLFT